MDKTSFKIFIVALLISLLIFAGVFIYALKIKADNQISVKYVTNPSMFLTVENCVNKYVSLLSAKDSEAIYNVIDEEFKVENGITIYNVLANNKELSGSYSFVSQAMLEDEQESYKYYVRGYLISEGLSDNNFKNNKIEYGLIVKLDVGSNTYSIIPSEVGEYFEAF